MGIVTTASEEARLGDVAQAAVEKAVMDRFRRPGYQWGGEDCKRILHDWFPRILDRVRKRKGAEADRSDYEDAINDASYLLDELRDAFSWNLDRTLFNSAQNEIWTWPTAKQLMFLPKEWRASTSPTDTAKLAKALGGYVEATWLQHNIVDGAAINAFLFSALSHAMDLYRVGAFGPTDWAYTLRKFGSRMHPFWNQLFGLSLGWIVFPFLKWIMLPVITAALMFARHDVTAEVTFGLWISFLVYRLVTLKRRRNQKKDADRTIGAMRAAWEHSCGEIINPVRLRELVLDAEQKGAIDYPSVLHTLIDRAIMRDATALHTRKMVPAA